MNAQQRVAMQLGFAFMEIENLRDQVVALQAKIEQYEKQDSSNGDGKSPESAAKPAA